MTGKRLVPCNRLNSEKQREMADAENLEESNL